MNSDRLLKHFERISETPDAVARLRRFILDLAVRGKLVEQDPSDEPAVELLKRIRAEKARLVKEDKVKIEKAVQSRTPHTSTIQVPKGWQSVYLHDVCTSVTDGDHLAPPKSETGVPFLVIGNVRTQTIQFEGCRHVPESYYQKLDAIRRPRKGDVLYTLVGSYGIPVIVRDARPFCVQRHIGILRPSKHVNLDFLARVLASKFVLDQASECATGIAQKTVPLSGLRTIQILLPPLAEQHRIVAKVDELMALCDQLQAARDEREARRDRLVTASLHRLGTAVHPSTSSGRTDTDGVPSPVRAEPVEALAKAARFHLDHLARLTTRAEHIKHLRQAILNLAVQGRLVPQDPNDEPATELLKRIQTEKDNLIKKGKLKTQQFPPVIEEKIPFRLAPSWQWVPFGELITGADAGWSPKSEGFPRSGDSWGVLKVSAVSWDKFLPEENKQLFPGVIPPEAAQVHAGDFLISRANTSELVAKCVVVTEEHRNLILSDKIVRLQISKECSKRFLGMVNNHAEHARLYYAEEATGTSLSMKNVSRAIIYALAIPLPPLAEQHRIVAKVDELMALCDRLEVQLTTSAADSSRLLEAVLRDALSPALEDAA